MSYRPNPNSNDIPHARPLLHPSVVPSLEKWHQMVETSDLSALPSIVHADAVFRSPMAIHPYESRAAVVLVLSTVVTIFKDFTYYRTLVSPDGLSVILEFSANVNDKKLKGVDLIRFGEDGLIREFEVMVRPLSGLQELGGEMGKRLREKLPKFKGKL
ncbi:hypothetical protein A1Q1_01109 [Trichosporon asahii var. asahii CBS 2479]|uniref:SnoaL-like domain-containing protein n=1 Tax=Trichosporon asahii var. asahii (strain ATCC 90039 / CBS 2479 / JCM 2466 / KCTC 7840 / NBRC 103889/ NCYC 2677 / UAMH 7654) TaxID=1186058 RepID=J5QYD3_TRIAS|nr:hypothetical protein A1Q1_01109 [Trichosporon asahii var. asahii CBS 2479]EJT49753.1 hypothetical protein A1Q1_01109 [Trichosporon asahii var. asahii CBS 2479]